jgi:hypothetical protein
MFFFVVPDEKIQRVIIRLAKKYGVDSDKVVLHKFQNGRSLKWTLLRLISEREVHDAHPFPKEFVADFVQAVVDKQKRQWERSGGCFSFATSPHGITYEQMLTDQQAFSAHCALFHIGD